MIWVGVIEADLANIDYNNYIKGKDGTYLWYGGGTYYRDGQPGHSMKSDHSMTIRTGTTLDVWLDLMTNYEVTFGNEGKQYKWPKASLGRVKKDQEYRLAVVSHASGAATTVEIVEFNVTYKSII